MSGSIGIVGAGIAGLHLGLYLLQRGVGCTIYTEKAASELGATRLPSLPTLLGAARARDRELGTNHWDGEKAGSHYIDLRVKGMPELASRGRLRPPGLPIDMRVYLARLLQDFEARGGRVVVSAALEPLDVKRVGAAHDLCVVASGRIEIGTMFPRQIERSPWLEPQRRIFAGLFRGVRHPDELGTTLTIIPGQGEILENQVLTAEGLATGIVVEAQPGGALDNVTRASYEADPRAFEALVLELLAGYTPHVFSRVDPKAFRLLGPNDFLQTAIIPAARRAYLALGGERFALAVGDAFATHDPLLAQGANAASRSAFALGEMIAARLAKGERFDQAFCDAVDQRLWSIVGPSMEWTNALLAPPPPRAMALFSAAGRNSSVADAFASNFDDPAKQWRLLSGAEGMQAFLAGFPPVKPQPARSQVLKAS